MPREPNIVLILSDQHRYDAAGFAGNPDVRTPNLDALAKHGVHFSEAICAYTRCRPSRYSLMTGRHPVAHGIRDNETPLPKEFQVFPTFVKQRGYHTGAVGGMDFNPTRPNYGFDVFALAEQDVVGRYEDDYHRWLNEEGYADQVDEWDQTHREHAPEEYWKTFGAMTSNLPESHYSTTWIGNQAVRFLQHAEEPFFLWTGFVKPHHPFDPPAPWNTMYDPETLALREDWREPVDDALLWSEAHFDPHALTEATFRRILAMYYANISYVDSQIGRILATLTARGFTNNVIIYCSDHGDYMGQHGLILKSHGPPFDSVIRVPLVIAGLNGQRRGVRDDSAVELVDLAPTLLELAGAPAFESHGESLVPLLRGNDAPFRQEAYCESNGGVRVLRSSKFKLVESDDESHRAFYDLRVDPYEFDNRYGDPALGTVRSRMQTALRNRFERPVHSP